MSNEKNLSMRDSFINKIYNLAKQDIEVMIVSADMGAPALDKFRLELGNQFLNVGIAEENMISVAAGLASEGKKPYTMAIMPFTTSRCHEFIKLNLGLMKIPVRVIGIGTGFSYDDSGPTHHTTEDISIMRVIPNLTIFSPSDSICAAKIAEISYKENKPTYIRLDRKIQPNIYEESERFEEGFKELIHGENICIISTGNMVHEALKIVKDFEQRGVKIGVIDLYRLKPLNSDIIRFLSKYKKIISLEEQLLDGGFGSIISEMITDNSLQLKLKRIGLRDYIYCYGGRENIQKYCKIDTDSVIKEIEKL
jgi:transketolase